jgi:hypothetical protein
VRVFLSYHTPDEPAAQALKHAIEARGSGIEVFFAPYNLKLGAFWLPVLGEAITEANAFLIILGKQLGEWQKLEYYEAIDRKAKESRENRNFPVVPVKLSDRAPNLPFLSQFHWIESSEPSSAESLPKILGALTGPDNAPVAEPWRTLNPYRGLESLREEDAEFFFGREGKTAEILSLIQSRRGRVIALIGNSGVGKSSLVQAGVIGSLKRQRWPGAEGQPWPDDLRDSRAWSYLTIKPGDQPLRALAGAFTGLWFEDPTDPARYQRTDDWAARLRGGGALTELLDANQARFQQMGLEPPSRIFLYVDQGEEFYSRASKEDAARFFKLVAESIADRRLSVMTSLRSDYYGYFQANESLFPIAEKVDVPPLNAAELGAVLREPARRLNVGFDSAGFVDQMVEAAYDQPGALPLLADAMTEVWKQMQERGDKVLRVTERPEILQVGNSLAKRADLFLERNPTQQRAIRDLFTLKLVSIPFEGEPVRRRALRTECTDQEWALVEALAEPEWRILVTGETEGVPTAEVAHEIILTRWATLSRWLSEEREFLIWKGQVERASQEWRKAPFYFKRDALLSGEPLFQAKRWIATKQGYLQRDVNRFVKKSLRRKRPALVFGVLGVIMVLLFIASSIAFRPLTERYAELMQTDPEAAQKLFQAPEYFWNVAIFGASLTATLLMILIFIGFVLKWLLWAVLRLIGERSRKRTT